MNIFIGTLLGIFLARLTDPITYLCIIPTFIVLFYFKNYFYTIGTFIVMSLVSELIIYKSIIQWNTWSYNSFNERLVQILPSSILMLIILLIILFIYKKRT